MLRLHLPVWLPTIITMQAFCLLHTMWGCYNNNWCRVLLNVPSHLVLQEPLLLSQETHQQFTMICFISSFATLRYQNPSTSRPFTSVKIPDVAFLYVLYNQSSKLRISHIKQQASFQKWRDWAMIWMPFSLHMLASAATTFESARCNDFSVP